MENEAVLEVNHKNMIRQIRNKIAEDIARKHIREFFVQELNSMLTQGAKIDVSLEVINPTKDLMSLFKRTKVKGWIKKYRESLLKLVNALSKMNVTPDIAIILQILVWKESFLDVEHSTCEVALVEVKRGKAGLNSYQKKDVEMAENDGIPYYLLRVDDSNFLYGKFSLTFKLLTSKSLTLPIKICKESLKLKKIPKLSHEQTTNAFL
ncbi:MAG: hypothetical protein QXU46_06255 [Candidatus Bathyarchaeia archaeon]